MMNNLTWQAILKLTIRLMPIVRGAITSVMKEIAQKGIGCIPSFA